MLNSTSQKAESIRDVIRYLQKFKNALIVIYFDDKTILSPLFSSHIRDISLLHQVGIQIVLIPGAKQRIDEILQNSQIEWKYHENLRVTNQDAMPLIKMAAFDVSNTIMTSLAANNISAVIGNWVKARSKGILNGFDFGTAGEIEKLEVNSIKTVLNNGFIPIFPCIGWNSVGHPYNISSILLAQQIAQNLKADKLFFVMNDCKILPQKFNIPNSISISKNNEIPAMNIEQVDLFLQQNPQNHENSTIIELLKTCKMACLNGVTRSHILNGNLDGVLPCEIFSDLGFGTMIYTNNYGKIRKMEQNDIPSVLSIMKPYIEEGKLLPRTELEISLKLNEFIVYEFDGGVHACASIHFYEDNQAEIAAVAVDKNFSSMGIGFKLVHFLVQKAKEQNASSIFIMTTQAIDWFEKLGFTSQKIETLPEERKKIWSPKRNSKLFRLNF